MKHDDNPQHDPDPEQQAREAWEKLPQRAPSREALPPAGGGLGAFFGLFTRLWERIRGQQGNTATKNTERDKGIS